MVIYGRNEEDGCLKIAEKDGFTSPNHATTTTDSSAQPDTNNFTAPLHRKLKSRHLQMIAIGGIIGPGLLVGSGNALHLGGPAGILISFSLVGIIIFFVMQSLGELATAIPVTGSFTEYSSRFVDDSLGFALGWAYWYLWVTVLANEYNALSLVMGFWTDVVPQWAWISIFWVIFLAMSNLGVLAYGEVEFWLSFSGGIGNRIIGFKYWKDPGAFADSINGVARTFVIAGTLYAGTEMVGVTSGESRMMFFIGILIPYNDELLVSAKSKTGKSPLTIALQDANIAPGAHLINALIVVSEKAPALLGITNKMGVPWVALLFSNALACIAFISVSSSAGKLYEALITLSGVASFIVWTAIGITHIRFRKALAAQGEDPSTLPFKAAFYPYGTYISVAANVFLLFFQGYPAFLNPFSAEDFVINYILLPVFVGFVVFWKFYKKTKWVKVEEMDIWSGRRDYGEAELAIKRKALLTRVKNVVVG
ncbi:uncharacterized protein PADG_00154 [Paracoccidioides brasiliensis Pb18]|uniref:Amino acid permease/ SLC12A domain-containing protein n=1 Tax=Paracoccidioides brasiliensis (strain Pb18) TaxID=502780 RepID=C1FZW4_PARBD|nr:uncharacterized protein PADG_00154 [Paracoccidioides brasiliensis Pb18]EEH43865.2 hypothetical protein PADG_00154 [Paracoccidioides brasiliensis Pb18]